MPGEPGELFQRRNAFRGVAVARGNDRTIGRGWRYRGRIKLSHEVNRLFVCVQAVHFVFDVEFQEFRKMDARQCSRVIHALLVYHGIVERQIQEVMERWRWTVDFCPQFSHP